jgi:hypothetical protein
MKIALQGGLSGSFAVGLGIVLAIEGAVLHVWVAERSQVLAWAITAVNIATLAWLWRECVSTRQASLVVAGDEVRIDAGSRLRCRFPTSSVATVEAATWRSVPDMATDFVSTAKPLEPNIIIALREPVYATLVFGVRKRVSRIGIRVADPNTVAAALSGDAIRRPTTAT